MTKRLTILLLFLYCLWSRAGTTNECSVVFHDWGFDSFNYYNVRITRTGKCAYHIQRSFDEGRTWWQITPQPITHPEVLLIENEPRQKL